MRSGSLMVSTHPAEVPRTPLTRILPALQNTGNFYMSVPDYPPTIRPCRASTKPPPLLYSMPFLYRFFPYTCQQVPISGNVLVISRCLIIRLEITAPLVAGFFMLNVNERHFQFPLPDVTRNRSHLLIGKKYWRGKTLEKPRCVR